MRDWSRVMDTNGLLLFCFFECQVFLLFLECKTSDLRNCVFIKEVTYCHRRGPNMKLFCASLWDRLTCSRWVHIVKTVYLKVFLESWLQVQTKLCLWRVDNLALSEKRIYCRKKWLQSSSTISNALNLLVYSQSYFYTAFECEFKE